MTELVFPQTAGMAWGLQKTPMWSSRVQKSVSGKRQAIGYMSYPIYKYTVSFNVLREYGSYAELEALQGFFNQMKGQVDTFKFVDPSDCVADFEALGTGTGTNAVYQLVREFGGFVEPVTAPGIVNVYRDKGFGRGLLSTTSKTNLYLRSEEFDNASWTKTEATITANATLAPTGSGAGSSADQVVEGAGTVTPRFFQQFTSVVGTSYTQSIYVKETAGAKRYLNILMSAGFPTIPQATFDLAAGVCTYQSAGVAKTSIEPLGSGWYRCSMTSVPCTTGAACAFQFRFLNQSGATASFIGDGASGMYVWGAQLMARSDLFEYVATTSAAVTVPADYSISSTGLITLAANLASGHLLSWSGTFYWRCAFTTDTLDFINSDGVDIWKTNKITFETTK